MSSKCSKVEESQHQQPQHQENEEARRGVSVWDHVSESVSVSIRLCLSPHERMPAVSIPCVLRVSSIIYYLLYPEVISTVTLQWSITHVTNIRFQGANEDALENFPKQSMGIDHLFQAHKLVHKERFRMLLSMHWCQKFKFPHINPCQSVEKVSFRHQECHVKSPEKVTWIGRRNSLTSVHEVKCNPKGKKSQCIEKQCNFD